jgi:hypothetical protein
MGHDALWPLATASRSSAARRLGSLRCWRPAKGPWRNSDRKVLGPRELRPRERQDRPPLDQLLLLGDRAEIRVGLFTEYSAAVESASWAGPGVSLLTFLVRASVC